MSTQDGGGTPLNVRAAYASVSTALFLLGLKAWAAVQTASVAMLGSLADTGLDLVASLVLLFSVRYAAMPPDEDHRFGHGKAESLAALFQVALIAVSAALIAWRAVQRLMSDAVTVEAESGILVSVIAIVATFFLIAYQKSIIRRTRSIAIETDSLHYQSDLVLNLSVIAALVLDQYAGIGWIDPLFGVAIAVWLGWGAWRGAARAIDQLMDREWPEEKRLRFIEVAHRHEELRNLHDLRTRTSGNRDFAQFHVDMPATMTVEESHHIIHRVEADLCRAFPDVEVLIHIDPEGHVDEPGNALVEEDQFKKLAEES
ncbi:cation diffusion facilitator family transporter [Novosphingopyxis baekryungensis]|uniref:cation diffusion facilitator family transporter n=1 Tax=Novosphingopyxis baekryungensis TaxID=279369 RepID=UPI0003B5CEB7|nr:cation diffusion facilitator family transporter [Novosphingopyxis baekryungensis]